MALTLTKHAKERYAQRIMGRDHPTDIAVFIRDHEGKIQNDIEKMVEYGSLLYEGPTSLDPKRNVGITLNGHWVVIWDTREFIVITLYCIDLGVGDDVNKAFIDNAVRQIEEAQAAYEATVKHSAEQVASYMELIEKAQGELDIHKGLCRSLEDRISALRQMVTAVNTDNDVAKDKVRECVETLIGKPRF